MSKELIIKTQELSSQKVSICVPVVASTVDSVLQQVTNCVEANVPMIELRADYFDFLEDRDVLEDTLRRVAEITDSTMVLFTIRTDVEGGELAIAEELYRDIISFVSTTGYVDIIDLEISHVDDAADFINILHNNGAYVLASHHDFHETPELLDMIDLYGQMHNTGADILKLAVMPNTRDDVVRSLQAANMVNEEIEDALICSISMGSLGKVSRIAGSLVGSCISFAALDAASAPGQLSYHDMNTIIKILEK